jgi:hypothetical protein
VAIEVKSKNSIVRSIFLWLSLPEEAFIGSGQGRTEPEMITTTQKPNTRLSQDALAAFVQKKTEIDAMLARFQELSDEHFGYGPDEVTWSHVGSLEQYAELLKRITDSAFKEGEHAE